MKICEGILRKSKDIEIKTLQDDKHGLMWERYDGRCWRRFSEQENEVDSWSDNENIRKYISKRRPISQHLTSLVNNKKNMFYAYANGKVVGVVLIARPEKDYEFATIDYIVVDPKIQGQGVAVRMISSIKDNGEFFADGYLGKIDAFVDSHNTASQRALKKSGFVASKPDVVNGLGGFCRWYFEERSFVKE